MHTNRKLFAALLLGLVVAVLFGTWGWDALAAVSAPSAKQAHSRADAVRSMAYHVVPFKVMEVMDGDTVKGIARVWPSHQLMVGVRIRGIDTAELRGGCESSRA